MLLPGITEFRPWNLYLNGRFNGKCTERSGDCAATVLATVMSKPTDERCDL